MIQPPDLKWPRRILWGLAGGLWFLWIAYEDRGLGAVTTVSAVIAAAGGLTLLDRWRPSGPLTRKDWVVRLSATGLVAGAAIGPLNALMILVKVSLHVHPQSDFTAAQVLQAVSRTWISAGVGSAIGAAAGFATRRL